MYTGSPARRNASRVLGAVCRRLGLVKTSGRYWPSGLVLSESLAVNVETGLEPIPVRVLFNSSRQASAGDGTYVSIGPTQVGITS